MEPGFFPPHSGPRGGLACAGGWGPAELFSPQWAPGIWQHWHWGGSGSAAPLGSQGGCQRPQVL